MTDLTDATQTLSLGPGPEDLSPLEQDVLEEYERLADNMKKVIETNCRLPRYHDSHSNSKIACIHA